MSDAVEASVVPSGEPPVPYDSGGRARFTIFLLAASILLDMIGLWSGYQEIQLLQQLQARVEVDPEIVERSDARQSTIALLQLGMFVVTAIAFLMWIHRAYRNLPALGARDLRFSPGWAVGWFFVPIMNLFRPYQVMKELWLASDPEGANAHDKWQYQVTPWRLPCWWAAWLVMNGVGRVSARVTTKADTLGELLFASWLSWSGDVLSIVASLLAIMVVRGIDRRQEERFERLQAAAGLSPYRLGS